MIKRESIFAGTMTEEGTSKISILYWTSFAICFFSNVFSGLISTLMSVYLPLVVKLEGEAISADDMNYIGASINALYLIGWAIGGFTWGWISDAIGRARAILLALSILGLFSVLTSLSVSWMMVVILRFGCGFAVGGILVITPTLLSEIWPASSRSIVLGIDSIGFPVGIFSSGIVNYFFKDWREGFMVGVFPILLAILSIWFLVESSAWEKTSSASDNNEKKYTAADKANLLQGAIIFSSMLIGLWGMFSWIPTWVQSLLTNSDGQHERSLAMMLLGAGGLCGGFLSGWVSNALGVRKAMMLCFSACLIISFMLFGLNRQFSMIIYPELATLSLFFGISQGLLSIYIPQLFPVKFRGTATGFCFNIGRFATAAAVFFIGVLVSFFNGYGNALLAFASIFVVGFVTIYFTRNQPEKSN